MTAVPPLDATNRMTRIKRLWSQGYVHGVVEPDKHYPARQTLKITLRDKGREALQVPRS